MTKLHILLSLVWTLAALVILPTAGASPLRAQEPSGEAVSVASQSFELQVIRLANRERIVRGLPPLRRSRSLTVAARVHNQDMIENDFFSHTGSDGSTPPARACARRFAPYGWGDCFVAENIGAGYGTPPEVTSAWMSSPGHSDNILNPLYREIGVGYTAGGSYGHYWTMVLGAEPDVLPVFINQDRRATASEQVRITLTREDVSSWGSIGSITGVQVSEDASFSGAVWQPWTRKITFALSPGNGTKTVYVRFSDGSKQVISQDSIILNDVPPTPPASPAD